jgi:hypothetical protein
MACDLCLSIRLFNSIDSGSDSDAKVATDSRQAEVLILAWRVWIPPRNWQRSTAFAQWAAETVVAFASCCCLILAKNF